MPENPNEGRRENALYLTTAIIDMIVKYWE